MSRFSVTTPIYYVNAAPHLGHTYTTVVADLLARYHRQAGEETFFLTGTDEHGDKIAEVAAAHGLSPQELADRNSRAFRETWDAIGISYDRFIRTTDEDHRRAVQTLLRRLYEAGEVDFREYEGLYCVGCERFLTERDMQDGKCRDHEREPERRREANYFFRMSRHFPWLVRTLEEHPDLIRPERYRNEVLGMLREDSGLEDLCISRPRSRLGWGIELPFDADYVCYVWIDALINYLTGVGFPDDPEWSSRWSSVEHLIGKDILKTHGIYWTTFLHAAGIPLFRHLHVHGYWNVDARKISKTLGNAISPRDMQARYGFEPFRFYLLREMSYGLDASFDEQAMVTRANADLSNALGNLVSRTLQMTRRFASGRVPEPGKEGPEESRVREALARAAGEVDAAVRRVEPHRALEAIFRAVAETNRYLDQRAPWKAAKDPARQAELGTTLFTACQALHGTALLLAPFLPEAAAEILRRLGAAAPEQAAPLPEAASDFGALAPGTPTAAGAALFPRLEGPESAS